MQLLIFTLLYIIISDHYFVVQYYNSALSLECKRNIIIQELYNCNMLYCLYS